MPLGDLVDGLPLAEREPTVDLITTVAVLHHLDLDESPAQMCRILAPGGRLLVVGLARPATARDLAWDAASAIANPLIESAKHPRRPRVSATEDPCPVMDPRLTFDEIRAAVTRELPGAHMRRHLAFRYTLEWTKP
ncbi:MAG: class I SAM-dependent methyltransferase [Gordonia sp. (in: high G+C Gram-positive bacteria)]